MSKRRRIPQSATKDNNISNSRIRIPKENIGSSSNCSFSFKYLKIDDEQFPAKIDDASYYHKLLDRLRNLSYNSVKDLRSNRTQSLRCHPIDWNDKKVSRDCFNIPNEEQLCDRPYQISVSSNEYGRMHGFFTGDIFNVVWLDRDHALYSSKRR